MAEGEASVLLQQPALMKMKNLPEAQEAEVLCIHETNSWRWVGETIVVLYWCLGRQSRKSPQIY